MTKWWEPPQVWQGEDAYVLGGGPSLKGFHFEALAGRHVVGCNSAYKLGPSLVPIVFFGDDAEFWQHYREGLEAYWRAGGTVVTNNGQVALEDPPDWLLTMRRQPRGLATGNTLAWNTNSGAAALNLALSLGAQRVHLLGFDMSRPSKDEVNWYEQVGKTHPSVHDKHLAAFDYVVRALPVVFPGREVINLSTVSRLTCFPMEDPAAHFGLEVASGV